VRWLLKNLKRHKSPGSDEIPAEFIKPGGRTIHTEIHKLINSIWNKKEFHEKWKTSLILPLYKKDDKTDYSKFRGI